VLAQPRFPEYLDDILAVTGQKRQRPAWTFPGRWIPGLDRARLPGYATALPWRAIVLVVLLLLAAAVALLIAGSRPNLPPPIGPARNGLFAWDNGQGIALTDPVTGVTTMVPGTTSADHGPSWSADGTTLGFVRFEDGAERVGYVHPDGNGLQIVPDTDVMNVQQALNDPTEIGWASDSRLLGYISATDSRLHVVDTTDGSDRAVSPPGVYVDSLSWRPGSA
jgi:hypothetical protein